MSKDRKYGTSKLPQGGYGFCGQAIGIICTDPELVTEFTKKYKGYKPCRIPGDLHNATTFHFPITYKIVKGVTGRDIVDRKPSPETELKIVEAAKELEREGVKAIATSCGFMIRFQEAMADAVSIPVFSSSLLQVPWVSRLLGKGQQVGIITFDSNELSKDHLKQAGIDESVPIAIFGLDMLPAKKSWYNIDELDPQKRLKMIEDRLVYAANQLVSRNPNVGAIVLECSNLPPAAASIQEATGLPVFDVTTLLNWAYDSVVRERFTGFM